jgi:phosphatidylserine/phosphatidylglycerophosphate/cardiolipin synthase-like enzyme
MWSCRSRVPSPRSCTSSRRTASSGSRGVPARAALRPAPGLPGAPVPVVAGDREHSCRQAPPPPGDEFRVVIMLPGRPNTGEDDTRGQLALLAEADGDHGRFLATTIRARSGNTSDRVYVHAKVGIIDDRWLTLGSANLNAHSFFNDGEVNVVTFDPALARDTRLRLWAAIWNAASTRSPATRAPSSTNSGARSPPSGASAATAVNRSRTSWSSCRRPHAAANDCSTLLVDR